MSVHARKKLQQINATTLWRLLTFWSIKLTIAPQYAAVRRWVTTIHCKLVIEVYGLLEGSLCT